MNFVDLPPNGSPEWNEIFNRAWMAFPLEVREQIAATDDGSRDAGHYLARAVTLLRVQRDTAQEQVSELRGRLDSRQAHIDALMWEYCPEDMTPEQRVKWAGHQRAVKGSKPIESASVVPLTWEQMKALAEGRKE